MHEGTVVWSHECAFRVNVVHGVVDPDVPCAWLDRDRHLGRRRNRKAREERPRRNGARGVLLFNKCCYTSFHHCMVKT